MTGQYKYLFRNGQRGFTIVELLIVIVVIAILAAIVIVAYNGIQNRANDTAIQADLRNLAVQVYNYQTMNGDYPTGNYNLGITGIPVFHAARPAYQAIYGNGNLFYCAGMVNGVSSYALISKSQSGTAYMYSSWGGAGLYTGPWGGYPTLCPAVGMASYTTAYGFFQGADRGWYSWTQ